ncbi:MAG: rhamnogalacturonan lyase [Bacteroidales bacterium]
MKNLKLFILLFVGLTAFQCLLAQRQVEKLDRGLVALKETDGVFLSWRLLGTEKNTGFNIYKNGVLHTSISSNEATNYKDALGLASDSYQVKSVADGVEEAIGSKQVLPWSQQYMTIQLDRPESGTTPPNYVKTGGDPVIYAEGQNYSYFPDDSSIGDLDGDGEYEIVVKWYPSNALDNSQTGITGPIFIDAYKLDGTRLWRISLGKNIRAGAHYTQFLVYDFDGDGKAEMVCKTAPGSVDGLGNNIIIGTDDPNADYRNLTLDSNCGYILNGPEYLTIFDGLTGAELNTVNYEVPRGTVSSWGDTYGNRVDRFLACVAYLDGIHPSIVMGRGYYAKTTLVAYDFMDGQLSKRWEHISAVEGIGAYGQGNHNLSVADVDDDGFDEVIYGSCAFDQDGTVMYRTKLGHGDAMHVSDLDPDRPGLEVWQVLESAPAINKYGYEMHDARTGEIIWGAPTYSDNGRGLAADIDANHRGFEMWSAVGAGTYNCKGVQISTNKPSLRFRIYWDGDLQDELLDGNVISKWNGTNAYTLYAFSGVGAHSFPNLSADILGDWREEVLKYDGTNPSVMRLYTTSYPTVHRLYTLMHDQIYRLGIAWQNVAYNQPPHLGFYIGDGLNNIPWPLMEESTGIVESSPYDNGIKVYSNKVNSLRIDSNASIESVLVYSLSGVLLAQKNGLFEKSVEVSLPYQASSSVLIVKVVSKSSTKTIKIIK